MALEKPLLSLKLLQPFASALLIFPLGIALVIAGPAALCAAHHAWRRTLQQLPLCAEGNRYAPLRARRPRTLRLARESMLWHKPSASPGGV